MQREWEEEKSVGSQTVNTELKPWNQKHAQQCLQSKRNNSLKHLSDTDISTVKNKA